MIKINNKFDFKQEVYVRGDTDHIMGFVVMISMDAEGGIVYSISRNGEVTEHYDFELLEVPDLTV